MHLKLCHSSNSSRDTDRWRHQSLLTSIHVDLLQTNANYLVRQLTISFIHDCNRAGRVSCANTAERVDDGAAFVSPA